MFYIRGGIDEGPNGGGRNRQHPQKKKEKRITKRNKAIMIKRGNPARKTGLQGNQARNQSKGGNRACNSIEGGNQTSKQSEKARKPSKGAIK